MTIGILVKLTGAVIAVADGRLSAQDRVSLDTTDKISIIKPVCTYPLSSMGAKERTKSYERHSWGFMYAGTYTLASEIRDAFQRAMQNILVDRGDDGKVTFVSKFSGRHRGNGDFYIRQSELPEVSGRIVVSELRRIYEDKASEWFSNKGAWSDVEIIIFGMCPEVGDYKAYVVSLDQTASRPGAVATKIDPIETLSAGVIGDPAAASAIHSDAKLQEAISATAPTSFGDDELAEFWESQDQKDTGAILKRMIDVANASGSASIGGNIVIVTGDQGLGFAKRVIDTPIPQPASAPPPISAPTKPHFVGLNHVALEVGDIEEALRFYGAVFSFELRGRHDATADHPAMAFLDMGDQFLALIGRRRQAADDERHFGLVVDDRTRVMELAEAAGATILDRPFNFLDPWGNHLEIVAYRDVQFSKTDEVLRSMSLVLPKTDEARVELRKKLSSAGERR